MENTDIQQTNQNTLKPSPVNSMPIIDELSDENVLLPISDDIIGIIKFSEDPDSISRYFIASPMFAGFGDLNSPKRLSFLQDLSKSSLNLRAYFTSAETIDLLFSIGKNREMDNSQISSLSIIVRELLTGEIFIKELPQTISSRLGIDDIKAGEIANELTSKSFVKILDDLKRIQRSKFPDKIMQLQKESRPEGLSAKPQVPAGVKDMPLNRPLSVRPAESVRPTVPPAMTPPKPVQTQPPQPKPFIPPQPPKPPVQPSIQPQRPPIQPQPATPKPNPLPPLDLSVKQTPLPRQSQPSKPAPITPKPQFKIPDIGQPVTKENNKPADDAQRSLEAELEKVASVIDLRSKSEN